MADVIRPCSSHSHPEQRLNSEALDVAQRVANHIIKNERPFNDFLKEESNGEATEFRLMVNVDGSFYCHVVGRDSGTFDGKLLEVKPIEWSYYHQKWIK